MILRPFKRRINSARVLKELSSYHQEMTDVVVGSEKVQIEIRLEMRLEILSPAAAAEPHLVLIRVDHLHEAAALSQSAQGFRRLIQGVWRQHVVMVEETDKITCAGSSAGIRVARDPSVFLKADQLHAAVALFIDFKKRGQLFVFRTRVRDYQLQMRIGLAQHGIRHLPEINLRRIPDRHKDRKLHGPVKFFLSLGLQRIRVRRMLRKPGTVRDIVRSQPFPHPDREILWSVVAQIAQGFPDIVWSEFLQQ